jgi:hypothetical protein
MVYVIPVCEQLASRIRMELQFHPDPSAEILSRLVKFGVDILDLKFDMLFLSMSLHSHI